MFRQLKPKPAEAASSSDTSAEKGDSQPLSSMPPFMEKLTAIGVKAFRTVGVWNGLVGLAAVIYIGDSDLAELAGGYELPVWGRITLLLVEKVVIYLVVVVGGVLAQQANNTPAAIGLVIVLAAVIGCASAAAWSKALRQAGFSQAQASWGMHVMLAGWAAACLVGLRRESQGVLSTAMVVTLAALAAARLYSGLIAIVRPESADTVHKGKYAVSHLSFNMHTLPCLRFPQLMSKACKVDCLCNALVLVRLSKC